jgi:dolichol-phosphate mannosyltransferase
VSDPELSIVVPTRNEEGNIPALLDRIDAALAGLAYEVVVVDDSDDRTPDVVEEQARAGRPVRLIHREGCDRAGGLATAVVKGLAEARGRYIASLDADLQHPPEKLRELVAALADADVAVASRHVPGGSAGGLEGPVRRLGSPAARLLAQALLPRARLSTDPLGGFFALRREVVEGVTLRPIGFKILLEVLVRGRVGRVSEVPYTFQPRHAGRSKASPRQMWLYLRHVARLRFGDERAVGLVAASVGLGLIGTALGVLVSRARRRG